jgi:2-oxo-4-hydroxy-4-carboxy-5-ureidoimidazoline decarboxylase
VFTLVPSLAVDRVNSMPAGELAALLLRCLAVPRWAEEVAAGRPYPDAETLFRRAQALTAGLSDAEVRTALADHPRIGARPAGSWSAAEQSGVDDQDVEPLRVANLGYERRFGHSYLVCATGMTGRDMLADLRARMANEPAAELAVVRRELAKIARIRLGRVIGG